MSSPEPEDRGCRALPQVRLLRDDKDGAVVAPLPADAAGAEYPPFEPFSLVKFPRVMSDLLASLADRVYRGHDRCVAAVLLLELPVRTWQFRVPVQRCSHTSACWSVRVRDVQDVPANALLAGSFQSRRLSAGEEVADAVPPHDGLHLVQVLEPHAQVIHCFLRGEGRTDAVPPQHVLLDDVELWLSECRHKLVFV